MDVMLFTLCFYVAFCTGALSFAVLITSQSRLFITCLDIIKNLRFLMKDGTEPFPYKTALGFGSGVILSFATLLCSVKLVLFELFLVSIIILSIFNIFLMRTIGIWVRKCMESVSNLIAEIRFSGDDRSSENNQWRFEQEQWLLILDTLGDSISRNSELLIDESICGKKQPLTPNNKWKLETMSYRISETASSQIKLDNSGCVACPL